MATFDRIFEGRLVHIGVGGEQVTATDGHPFWVISGEALEERPAVEEFEEEEEECEIPGRWVQAGDLRVGDVLETREHGRVQVESLVYEDATIRTYNLTIAEDSNYTIGENGLWVHNAGSKGRPRATPKVPKKQIVRVPKGGKRKKRGAPRTRTRIPRKGTTRPVRDLRRAGHKDAHHIIQEAAVRDLPGYDSNSAPGVALPGPSNVPGTPHHATRAVQREPGGGTYAAERRIGYKTLRKAGYTPDEARRAIDDADRYFASIGVKRNTVTRIPLDRR